MEWTIGSWLHLKCHLRYASSSLYRRISRSERLSHWNLQGLWMILVNYGSIERHFSLIACRKWLRSLIPKYSGPLHSSFNQILSVNLSQSRCNSKFHDTNSHDTTPTSRERIRTFYWAVTGSVYLNFNHSTNFQTDLSDSFLNTNDRFMMLHNITRSM